MAFRLPCWTLDTGAIGEDKQSVRDSANTTLIDKLVNEDQFASESFLLSKENSCLASYLRSLTANTYFFNQNQAKRQRIVEKYRFAFELMVGWIIRLWNEKLGVFPCCVLSLWALRCRVPGPFWDVLRKIRLLYGKGYTRGLALDVGKRIEDPEHFPNSASRKVIAGVGDNCLVKFSRSYEGVKDEGDGSFPYLFINWIAFPIEEEVVPADYDPRHGACHFISFHLIKFP